jgi:hypothetical protein
VSRVASAENTATGPDLMSPEHRALFHRLNNKLGIVLAHAELLESKAEDPSQRGRATQIVTSVLEALRASRELQQQVDPPHA